MAEGVQIWEVLEGGHLQEIRRANLDLEHRLENWLAKDASIIAGDLLVIGRQVRTDFGMIDLLCLDRTGNLSVVELKRGLTPREVIAQVLEYAAWAQDLTATEILEMANGYLGDSELLNNAFAQKFGEDLPDNLNTAEVSTLIVAADIDQRTEKVIRYLSNTYGARINAVTFNYFSAENGRELLARLFVLEPEQVENKSQAKGASKRTPPPTVEELCERARRKGVEKEFNTIVAAAERRNLQPRHYANSLMYGPKTNRNRRLFTVSVGSTSGEEPNVKVFHETWLDFYPVNEQEVKQAFGESGKPIKLSAKNAESFIAGLDRMFKAAEETIRR